MPTPFFADACRCFDMLPLADAAALMRFAADTLLPYDCRRDAFADAASLSHARRHYHFFIVSLLTLSFDLSPSFSPSLPPRRFFFHAAMTLMPVSRLAPPSRHITSPPARLYFRCPFFFFSRCRLFSSPYLHYTAAERNSGHRKCRSWNNEYNNTTES